MERMAAANKLLQLAESGDIEAQLQWAFSLWATEIRKDKENKEKEEKEKEKTENVEKNGVIMDWYRRAASGGNPFAAYKIGEQYDIGALVKADKTVALEWYLKAAKHYIPEACEKIGNIYMDDPLKQTEAIVWLRKSVDQGHLSACNNLAFCLEMGIGCEKNPEAAVQMYRRGADEHGDAIAQFNYALSLKNGDDGKEPNLQLAFSWFLKAAQQGDKLAQAQVGQFKFYGLGGVPKNDAEAVSWFQKAADGCDSAAFHLADCFYFGKGIAQNFHESYKLFKQLGDRGHKRAPYSIGICLEKGHGVEKDMVEAVKWYERGAKLGDKMAQLELGNCFERGLGGLEIDENKAIELFRQSSEEPQTERIHSTVQNVFETAPSVWWLPKPVQILIGAYAGPLGWIDACFRLGQIFIAQNKHQEASHWLKRAADQNDADAAKLLSHLNA